MKKVISIILASVMLIAVLAGCGETKGTASVESVAMICGIGPVGQTNRFSGIVTAGETTNVNKDDSFTVADLKVSVGDDVKAGDILFTYDTESGQLSLEKAKLELEQMQKNLEDINTQKKDLEKQKERASGDLELSLTLEIRDLETRITESEYNIKSKQSEISKLETSLKNAEVASPIDGRIQTINENGGYDNYGNALPYITIAATQALTIKGYVNETNIGSIMEGNGVLIRARVGDSVWSGAVSRIDYDNPAQNTNYYSDDTGTSSKYPFYVVPASDDGMILGQHVYIEPSDGVGDTNEEGINLPEYYINDADGAAWVWAQNAAGKLERRTLELGEYDENMGTYPVLSGLSTSDYIAWPDESLETGMTCITYSADNFSDSTDYSDTSMGTDVVAVPDA